LGSLRISKEDALEETTEYIEEMSVALALATVQNKQIGIPKSMVSDPE